MRPQLVSSRFALVMTAFSLLATAASAGVVVLQAGSVDKLDTALRRAGKNGTVVLRAGLHTESRTVFITQTVRLVGEPGAVLVSTTQAAVDYPLVADPALHVLGAADVMIAGLTLQPPDGTIGGCGIVVEKSPRAVIADNEIVGTQFGILARDADDITIENNRVETSTAWQTGEIPEAEGIIVISGTHAKVAGNDVAGAFFGIWGCDHDGDITGNVAHDNYIGFILCRVPDDGISISGDASGAPSSAVDWTASDNDAHDNLFDGYLVIDGAHSNTLTNNAAHANGVYDIELVGDTERFGFFTPRCYENTVQVGSYAGLVIKDCGDNNSVDAPVVDNDLDPCF